MNFSLPIARKKMILRYGNTRKQDMLSLTNLDAGHANYWGGSSGWVVSSLQGLGAAHNLATLSLYGQGFTGLTFPAGLTNLSTLDLSSNHVTNFSFLSGLPRLTSLDLSFNQPTTISFPSGLTNLTSLDLSMNQLTEVSFLSGLTSLTTLNLWQNQLTNLALPSGLTNLATLNLDYNQITSLTLPPELVNLTRLVLIGNPLTTLVLPEPLAATGLAGTVASLRSGGASVYTYPLAVSLVSGQRTADGTYEFTIVGPPAPYTVLGSSDLQNWSELGILTNQLGTAH